MGKTFMGNSSDYRRLPWTVKTASAVLVLDDYCEEKYILGTPSQVPMHISLWSVLENEKVEVLSWEDGYTASFEVEKDYIILMPRKELSRFLGMRMDVNFLETPHLAYRVEDYIIIKSSCLEVETEKNFEELFYELKSSQQALDLDELTFLW